MRENKGITLIALVITIIVLLILAGVSIAMLSGDNSILNKATEAKETSGQGTLDEAAKIAVGNIMTDSLGWPYKESSGSYTKSGEATTLTAIQGEIESEITSVNSSISFAASNGGWTAGSGTQYTLAATVGDKTQTIIIDIATGAITKPTT